jgi:hypothetical protein
MARRLLLPAFSAKRIAQLEPFTRELCADLLHAVAGKTEFDAAVHYAQHYRGGLLWAAPVVGQNDARTSFWRIGPPAGARAARAEARRELKVGKQERHRP